MTLKQTERQIDLVVVGLLHEFWCGFLVDYNKEYTAFFMLELYFATYVWNQHQKGLSKHISSTR